MKGVIFNILESFVVEGWGDETYEEILSLCPLKTKEPFVGPGTYPDSDLVAIASKAAEKLGIPLQDALRAFGTFCFPKLATKYPTFLEGHSTAKSFLQSVETVIHVEVRKLYPKAVTPRFDYVDTGEDQLTIRYRSDRKFCHFMEGMLEAVGTHFKETVHHKQTACLHEGADHCEFELRFEKNAEQAA